MKEKGFIKVRKTTNKKNNKLIVSNKDSLMQEKTKILVSIEVIFLIAMVIIAFGSFIENTVSPIAEEKTDIKLNGTPRGEINLEKESETALMFEEKSYKE